MFHIFIFNKNYFNEKINFQHGRVKVRTTAEQEALKKKERAEKLLRYKAGMGIVFKKVIL